MQSIASYIFIYFACLTPIITFGGLLGDATENRIAAIESLISGLIVGVTYGFFSGQPLTILGMMKLCQSLKGHCELIRDPPRSLRLDGPHPRV